MTKEEVIEQLKSLKFHCEDMKDKEDLGDIYLRDSIALNHAIKILKKDLQGVQSQKGHNENKTNLIITRKGTN